jgi:hypothetical protein
MDWNISSEMVDELRAAGVPGLTTRLQAMLVFQHCTVHNLSLFDFFAKWKIEGLRLVPAVDSPASAPSAFLNDLIEDLAECDQQPVAGADPKSDYEFSDWRTFTLSSDRLERLRKHIAEVQQFGMTLNSEIEYLNQLREFEKSLARVVEPVPTLGMVADDDVEAEVDEPTAETLDDIESELEGVAAQPREEDIDFSQPDEPSESLPVIATASKAEQDDIAAVLANPKGAKHVESFEPRKDSAGRVLASDSRLEEIYSLAEKLGMNKVQAQEFICEKNKLRKVDELPEAVAAKIVEKMRQRISPA